ncbi:hypothetical protein SDC9_150593 [bioreactor metagenome]|uniref:Uncharacterized protein n=1 Tax=bioreactor metagenome TaxID=1076179 RepID=A0A645EMX2_9ZZZZ
MLEFFAFFDFFRDIIRTLELGDDVHDLIFAAKRYAFFIFAEEFGLEFLFAGRVPKQRGQRPVFLRHEGLDFALAVAHDAHRDRLHSAGRKAFFDLGPQQRADLIAHEPVEYAARLLCVYKVHIDAARLFDRVFDNRRRYLVKGDPAWLAYVHIEHLCQVPGYRFALAVRVCCEVYFIGRFGLFAYAFEYIAAAAQRNILGFEAVFHVNTELAFGKIAHMTV